MNRTFAAGLALTVVALAGYLIGTVAPYPFRGFTLAGIMIGITITVIGYGGASARRQA